MKVTIEIPNQVVENLKELGYNEQQIEKLFIHFINETTDEPSCDIWVEEILEDEPDYFDNILK